MLLLNPGPVNLSDRVRRAMLGPDLCHREAEFTGLQARIRAGLLRIYDLDPGRWSAVLLTGSGTAAVEAMVTSLVPPDSRLLVIENGVYGERMARIAEIHGIPIHRASHEWGAEVDVARAKSILDGDVRIGLVAVAHHETTTGRLNDLEVIGRECRRRGVGLLVDGISSFGAELIRFEDWGVAACAGVANKCLHAVPGVSFVLVRRDRMPADGAAARTLYLDLATHHREQDQGGTPFTQSVQCLYALEAALEELCDAGGWPARHERYARLATQVRERLMSLGIRPVLPEGASSCVLNAYRLPKGVSYESFHDGLKERGFVIYAGQGGLAGGMFRISTMGAVGDRDIARFLAAVESLLEAHRSVRVSAER
ncbi:MAG: 2-aminoethylphosphonate aminotransferase [Phycisphaerales bacterium]